jgi:hypothetical protein
MTEEVCLRAAGMMIAAMLSSRVIVQLKPSLQRVTIHLPKPGRDVSAYMKQRNRTAEYHKQTKKGYNNNNHLDYNQKTLLDKTCNSK